MDENTCHIIGLSISVFDAPGSVMDAPALALVVLINSYSHTSRSKHVLRFLKANRKQTGLKSKQKGQLRNFYSFETWNMIGLMPHHIYVSGYRPVVGQYIFPFSQVFLSTIKTRLCSTNQQNFNLTAQRLLGGTFRSILALLRGDSILLSQNVLAIDVGRTNVNDNVLQQTRLSYLSMQVMR